MKATLKKTNSLWIELSTRWGAREQVAMADIVDMATADVPIKVACLEGSPIHAACLRHPQITVYPLKSKKPSRGQIKEFLRETVEQVKPNILNIHQESVLWDLFSVLVKHPEISVVANRHVPAERSFFRDLLTSFYLRRLDYMVVLSDHVRRSVLAAYAIPEKKVKVINLGLDFSKFDPSQTTGKKMRLEWGADKETTVIGTVGRLMPEMGQDTFLKAAASLLKVKERKLKFVIVGEEPIAEEYLAELKQLVGLFHIEDFVVFTSLGDNLPEVMAAFDIFVMPGREEVPGLGALEALAMERPTILSNTSGATEILGNGQYGSLMRPEDAFDLQQEILHLLEKPSEREAKGRKGRVHVLKHYDKKTRSNRLFDIYEKCLKRRYAKRLRSAP